MTEMKDMELVQEYAQRNSEAAFAELVRRHVNLIYSVAMRYVGNATDAQDVTQAVFIILAKKASGLRDKTVVAGWLYETTRFTAINFLRSKLRRESREQEARVQSTLNNSDTETVWQQIAPLLENAMTRLSEKERALLALHFFENKSVAETAAVFGIEEWAARKRVSRAVEKLRNFFARRGIGISSAVLIGAITTGSAQAAPLGLVVSISAVAIKGTAASASTLTLIKGALKLMAWSKIKSAVIVGAGVLLLGGGLTAVVLLTKARVERAARENDPVAYQFRTQAPIDPNELRQQLVGNWVLKTKRLGVDKNYTYYDDDNRQKMWTLTNWAIVRYGDRSNIIYSASGPYELHGDLYTETVEKATGIMTNYIGTRIDFRLRVDGDKYYQTGLGDQPGLQEIGHRLP